MKDSRYFPRELGELRVRYRVVPEAEVDATSRAWAKGVYSIRPEVPWREPEAHMDFSASGLCFWDTDTAPSEGFVLVELQIPGPNKWHRATGRVVRVDAAAEVEDERGRKSGHRIAVDFTEIGPDAVEALCDYTELCQERALRGAWA